MGTPNTGHGFKRCVGNWGNQTPAYTGMQVFVTPVSLAVIPSIGLGITALKLTREGEGEGEAVTSIPAELSSLTRRKGQGRATLPPPLPRRGASSQTPPIDLANSPVHGALASTRLSPSQLMERVMHRSLSQLGAMDVLNVRTRTPRETGHGLEKARHRILFGQREHAVCSSLMGVAIGLSENIGSPEACEFIDLIIAPLQASQAPATAPATATALTLGSAPTSNVERAIGISVESEEETCCEIINLNDAPDQASQASKASQAPASAPALALAPASATASVLTSISASASNIIYPPVSKRRRKKGERKRG